MCVEITRRAASLCRRCNRSALGISSVGGAKVALFISRLEDLETTHKGVVNGHHGAGVVEFAAVVGRAEEGYQLASGEKFVAVFNHLMGAAYQINVVFLGEFEHNPFRGGGNI